MRTTMSVLCWIVAVVVGLLAVPVTWVADHVADQDGYVEMAGELRSDPTLLDAVGDAAAARIGQDAGLPEQTEDQLATGLAAGMQQASGQEGFDEAWDESQRRSHELWFGGSQPPEELQVDVAPLIGQALEHATSGLPVSLSEPEQSLVTVASAPPGLRFVESTPTWKTIALIAAGAAALLCIVFARRRAVALTWVGVGAVVVAAVTAAGSRMMAPVVLSRVESGFGDELVDALADRAVDSLDGRALEIAAAGGVIILISLAARLVAGRRAAG